MTCNEALVVPRGQNLKKAQGQTNKNTFSPNINLPEFFYQKEIESGSTGYNLASNAYHNT